jgi:hypothetical protein
MTREQEKQTEALEKQLNEAFGNYKDALRERVDYEFTELRHVKNYPGNFSCHDYELLYDSFDAYYHSDVPDPGKAYSPWVEKFLGDLMSMLYHLHEED